MNERESIRDVLKCSRECCSIPSAACMSPATATVESRRGAGLRGPICARAFWVRRSWWQTSPASDEAATSLFHNPLTPETPCPRSPLRRPEPLRACVHGEHHRPGASICVTVGWAGQDRQLVPLLTAAAAAAPLTGQRRLRQGPRPSVRPYELGCRAEPSCTRCATPRQKTPGCSAAVSLAPLRCSAAAATSTAGASWPRTSLVPSWSMRP